MGETATPVPWSMSVIEDLLPRAFVRDRHEADRLVDVEHGAVLLSVVGDDARRELGESAPPEQAGAFDKGSELVTSMVPQHQGVLLVRGFGAVVADDEFVERAQLA